MAVLQVLAAVAGVALVGGTLLSAIKTVVLPRAEVSTLTRFLFLSLRRLFDAVAAPSRSFRFRDRIMAYYAPVGLVLLPGLWVLLLVMAFTGILWGTGVHPLSTAFASSGSSLFTLGFVHPVGSARVAVAFVEALLGLGIVSLMISYLPTIYGAFSRREALVGMLEVRAGQPPSPVALITRYYRIGWLEQIDELYPRWEQWFVEVEESHTSQPALVFFRSPHPERNWLTAAGCVLDTAALMNSTVAHDEHRIADITIRTGFLTLRRIADYFGIAYDPDPRPDDPISVTRAEYDEVCAELGAVGVPLRADLDQAWRDFAGWRVNYDRVLVQLARLVMAPPAKWSSDRDAGPRFRPALRRRTRRRRAEQHEAAIRS
jgi:hypothetical protein